MPDLPDELVLAFAITGIWVWASVVALIAVMVIGRLFDLHLDLWGRHKARRAERRIDRLVKKFNRNIDREDHGVKK